jgi:hypothetical protein
MLLHLNSKGLDQTTILNSGWTGGFATAAVEAQIKVTFDRLGQFEPPIGDRSHQIDSPARAVIFVSRFQIGGTRRSTKAAMHAVEKSLVINAAPHARDRGCRFGAGLSRGNGLILWRRNEFCHSDWISLARRFGSKVFGTQRILATMPCHTSSPGWFLNLLVFRSTRQKRN